MFNDAIDLGEIQQEGERLEATGGSGGFLDQFVQMPERDGIVIVRILPPAEKGKKLFCATRTHRINNHTLHCPREARNINGMARWVDPDPKCPCCVCRYYADLWKEAERTSGEESEKIKNAARKIKPLERYYYNCIVRSQKNNRTNEIERNVGPKILSVGKMLHQTIVLGILGDAKSQEKPLGNIAAFKDGRDFKINKGMLGTGPGAFPTYNGSKFLDPSPLGDKNQIDAWMSKLHDLSALRTLKSPAEMALELKRHLGIIPDEATGYDASEFMTVNHRPLLEQVEAARPQRPPQTVTPSAPLAEDEALSDDEFLADMQANLAKI